MKNIRSKLFSYPFRIGPYGLFLFILLLVGFFVRISVIEYPISIEAGREYLISHHIYAYNEFILTGPSNAIGNSLNSPLLHYLLASFMIIEDGVFFFGLMNIFLQLFTIIIIYLIAKKLFNPRTALIASILFAFSFVALQQSVYVWQPYIMQPFINFAYLLLALSYFKKNYPLLLLSSFIFFFAVAIHPSALGVFPMFLIVAFLILKTQRAVILRYVFFLCASLGSLLLYFPALIHIKTRTNTSGIFTFSFEVLQGVFSSASPYNFFQNLFHNASALVNQFFFYTNQPLLSINIALIFVLTVSVPLYFFYFQKDASKKVYLLVILSFIAALLLIGSFLKNTFHVYYFTPVLGLFVILIAEVLHAVFSRHILLKTAKIIIVVLLIYVFSSAPNTLSKHLQFLQNSPAITAAIFSPRQNTTQPEPINFFRQQRIMQSAMGAIKKEIFEIQKRENAQDINFFQFRVYRWPDGDGVDAIFWALLEKDLNRKFVIVSDSSTEYFKYELINDDRYIFLICHDYFSRHKDCTDLFLSDHPDHSLIKNIYSENLISVHLTKKTSSIQPLQHTLETER